MRINQRGQIAIFIALIFQVLFVFFAMAINVGMVVHDKINLQNSVDLAAYYGAQRQAEILNQIAHINYQMRQSFKLFTWRYRVLGSLGLAQHPMNPQNGGGVGQEQLANIPPPSFCITHDLWSEYNQLDPNSTICRDAVVNLPNIPPLTGGAGFVPGFNQLVNFVELTAQQFAAQCNEAGVLNWLFAARMLAHYRVDIGVRKQMVRNLTSALNQGPGDFQDIRGESVLQGARTTFENNLTESNRETAQMQFFNSMGSGTCANPDVWLPTVNINPVVIFTDLQGSRATGCQSTPRINRDGGGGDSLPAALGQLPQYNDPVLVQHWQGEPSNDLRSSIGFEKNPWCMTYVGVSAQSSVQKPFSALGGRVNLEARGFAKPFGGRIGPWYGRAWPPGAAFSDSTQKTDPLLPSRDPAQGGAPPANGNEDLINHSRFPGDALGMGSMAALSSMKGNLNTNGSPFMWSHYNHLGNRGNFEQSGDSLARDAGNPAVQRPFEIAALQPDLFDAYYYSVEPLYFENYFNANTTNSGALIPQNQQVYDFGSTKDGSQPNTTNNFNIQQQITQSAGLVSGVEAYRINTWQHLLTSWVGAGAVDYSFPDGRFGNCAVPLADREFPTTGNCVVGGRTGYSIKMVSRDYLLRSDHEIGGQGAGSGSILNPPTF